MPNKTQEVLDLVQSVIDTIPGPWSEHIILEVALQIETNARTQYDALCAKLTTSVVNQWIGRWTKNLVERTSAEELPAKGSLIIKSYTRLV